MELKMNIKKIIFPVFFAFSLIAFTVYIALDTFVIARVYTDVEGNDSYPSALPEKNENDATGNGALEGTMMQGGLIKPDQGNAPAAVTSSSYSDENITVTLTEYREKDTTVYVADVRLSSPEYLKTAFAKNAYGRNVTQKTSEIARAHNAILAINGDYYGAQEKGYVLKNGVLYRKTPAADREDLVIYADGSFEIITETQVSAEKLLADGAVQILSFGPALIEDGQIAVGERDEVGKAMADNPRTAIGIVDECHYLLIVSDGRTRESEGLTLYELAEFAKKLGVTTAYNLDGGGSSTMYFNGEVVNNPTTNGKTISERGVSDIVYIGY